MELRRGPNWNLSVSPDMSNGEVEAVTGQEDRGHARIWMSDHGAPNGHGEYVLTSLLHPLLCLNLLGSPVVHLW